jgi:protease I
MLKEKKLDSKNILMVIASKNFRDEEYFIPYEIFQKEGAKITTASSVEGEIIGIEGGEARSTVVLSEVNVRNFDAVVFIGGSGAVEYFNNNDAHKIIQEMTNLHKVVAAICIAPIILAKAGILVGKKATVWSSLMDKNNIKELENSGCSFSEERVVKDKKIITADGPAVSREFAEKIVAAIIERNVEENE